MRVALVLPGGVDRSGVDRVIPSRVWLVERLARRHDVHVFAMRQEPEPGSWDLLGARVHNIGTARGSTLRLMTEFGTLHRERSFDVVHAFFGWCGTSAAMLGWRYRAPVVFHASGGEFVSMPDALYGMRTTARGRAGLALALRGAKRVTVASRFMQQLAESHGAHADVVPLGVAIDRWPSREPRERGTARALRLLHVGDIRPVKDQTLLVAAAGHLRDAGVQFELDVAGLDTMSGCVQSDATTRGLGALVRWHGVLGRGELRRLMDEADLLVVSSRHEAGPLVVLEAAIAGVPSVGTAVGHVADWAPSAAISVPVGDARALAHEIAALAHDEPRRLALAGEAQRRAMAMDADYTAVTFERIYDEVQSER
ncbi:MAG: glycosyltransferase family 4 protein [Gemmatimonadaceae bacterium]